MLMKSFIKMFLMSLLCVFGLVTAQAKTEQVHATFENPSNTNTTWNAETRTFTWSTTYYNQLRNIGLPAGDITKYKKLVVDCDIKSGEQFRILIYKGGSNKTLYASNGVNEFILADTLKALYPDDFNEFLLDCSEICLSGNNNVAPGEAVINDVYLETYDDEGEKVYATFENPSNTNTTWNAETRTFTWSTTYYNQLRNIGLPTGDITKYKKLVVDTEIKSGDQFRILIYKGGSNKTLYASNGVNEFILADTLKALYPDDYNEFLLDCSEICLSGNNNVAPGEAVINSVYLETYPENESVEIEEIVYEEDPGKPEGDFVDFTEAFPSLQPRIGLGQDGHPIKLGNGDVVVGQRSKDVIADLSAYSKLTLVTSPNLKLVLYMNHEVDAQQNAGDYAEEDAGKYVFINIQADENGIAEVDLTQFNKQDLNCICLPWDNSNKGTVWYILLTEAAAEITPAYGVIWDATTGAVETAGDYKNIKLDAAYFNDFAQVGDIIRVNFTMPDASRGPLRTVADGQIALLDKNGQTIAEVSGIKNDEKPYEFVIDEAMKAKLYDEFVYVRYQNIEVTSIELVQGAVAEEVVTFDFNASNHAVSATGSNAGDITADEIIVEGGVTMTITPNGSGTPNRYWGTNNGPQLRMYGGTMTLVAPEGKAIVKVEYANGKWETTNTINGVVAAEGLWEGNSTNVVLAVTKNTQINKVIVTLADANDETTTYTQKSIANTEDTAYTVAEAINLIDAGEALTDVVFVKGIVSKVDKFQDGAITYWISDDGTTESAQFECYKGKGIDGADFTSIEDVEVGAAVIVTGTMTKYNDIYEFNAGNKLVKYEAPFKPAVADGTYYIYNVATHKYLAAGANWGTHATVNEEGLDFGVALVDGKYTLDSQVSNGGNNHFLNGEWCDGAAYGWTIEKVADDVLTISNGENYLTAGENDVVTLAADGTAAAAQWQFVPAATLEGLRMDALLILMGNATEEAPVDATYLIKAPKFNRNDLRNKAWTETHSGGNANIGKPDADRATYGVEFWNNTFDFNQTLTSLPDGIYEFSIAGYGTNGTTKIYANETEAAFVNTESAANFGAALDAIANGSYTGNTTGKVNVIGGTLKIGIKRTEQVGADWTVFDNAQLTYYGPITDPNAYKELYEEALAAAKDAQNSADYANVTGEEKAALDAAIQQYGNVDETDAAALEAAIKALTEATNAFKEAKAAYDALAEALSNIAIDAEAWPYASAEKQGAVEDALNNSAATNAADATAKTEALVKAYRAYIESNAKAEGVEGAGDATDKIVNPKAEEAIAEPWSVVLGEGSGGSLNILSNEPWTDSDGNSAHKYFDGGNWGASAWDVTLVQEVTLPKGQYLLTAKGRAAADVTLTLFAGEETKQMKAIGNAGGDFGRGWNDAWVLFNVTTDEPSTVKIGVQGVTAAQYNWMSFSDFRLTCLSGELTGIETIVNKTDAVEGIYNLNGQKVMKAQKGLYIINGKKVFVK